MLPLPPPCLPLLLPQAQVPVRDESRAHRSSRHAGCSCPGHSLGTDAIPGASSWPALHLLLRRWRWAGGSGSLPLRAGSPGATVREGVGAPQGLTQPSRGFCAGAGPARLGQGAVSGPPPPHVGEGRPWGHRTHPDNADAGGGGWPAQVGSTWHPSPPGWPAQASRPKRTLWDGPQVGQVLGCRCYKEVGVQAGAGLLGAQESGGTAWPHLCKSHSKRKDREGKKDGRRRGQASER